MADQIYDMGIRKTAAFLIELMEQEVEYINFDGRRYSPNDLLNEVWLKSPLGRNVVEELSPDLDEEDFEYG